MDPSPGTFVNQARRPAVPCCRYSLWVDSKLRLHVDPLLVFERFLWRSGHEYAISNHYDRHCVWEEVSALLKTAAAAAAAADWLSKDAARKTDLVV